MLDKLEEYLLDNFASSVIESLDPLVKNTVAIMNQFPGVVTHSSCQGHEDNGYWGTISFLYGDDTEIPKWIPHLMLAIREHTEDICLGCLRTNIKLEYYFDCGHDLKQWWTLEITPLRNRKGEHRESHNAYMKKILPRLWANIAKALQSVFDNYYK